ncbi:MAG: NAD-dependent epimerase/dehydratase family protein [Anaerolineales bacterium]|nr:NAD-dependent epimerase/dehydratase family protein [Anaerolineales bacterium]
MSSLLVTGGAGFIGSHLVKKLLDEGHSVRVLDDLSSGYLENIEGLQVDFIQGDICDQDLLRDAVQGMDLIFHLAAMVSVPGSMSDPQRCYMVNVDGTLNLLLNAREAGVQRVVLSSSAAVYGESEDPVDEFAHNEPQSPYASSKLAAEEMAEMFTRAYGFPTVSLRYFNVYGPRQRPDSPYAAAIPIFIKALLEGRSPTIYGDGLQTRDFVYVEDIVGANMLAAESENAVGGRFNIAGHGSITINELVDTLRGMIPGSPAPIYAPPRPGDIRQSAAVQYAAQQALGYRPEIVLERGLQLTVQWFGSKRAVTSI